MSLVTCKCTNCGGKIQINNDKDAAICPYCGETFIVENWYCCFGASSFKT